MIHHGTIRKYTAALLDVFNNVEVQYQNSIGQDVNKKVPLVYSSVEKSKQLDRHTAEQLGAGNTNVLPRANLAMSTMVKAEQRVTNKNMKIAKIQTDDTFEWMYNSVPYEFTFELTYMCRGMNEATMIIEQVAPKFNPTINIDVWDVSNLDEPTRVPVKLLDIGIEQNEYDELSSNVVIVSFGLSLMGNLYPPIRTAPKIKEFYTYLNITTTECKAKRADMLYWDVDIDGLLRNGQLYTNLKFCTDGLTPSESLFPSNGLMPSNGICPQFTGPLSGLTPSDILTPNDGLQPSG
jgi:hypothetical protein